MPHLPTGTTTFLFTDVEGSTCLWEEIGWLRVRKALRTGEELPADEAIGLAVAEELQQALAAAAADQPT